MESLLRDIVLVMAASLVAVGLLGRLRVPSVVCFLLAGLLVGPNGFGLIDSEESSRQLGEIGVVFLLFTVGLQFSVSELLRLKAYVLLGGGLQILLTVALVAVPATLLGLTLGQATFLGYMVAQTSTTVLLRVLGDRGEVEAPHGRFGLGVSIAQDLSVVPAILFLPLWAGTAVDVGAAWSGLGLTAVKLAGLAVGARFFIPWFLERVVRTRSREAFTLATLVGALGTAWLCGLVAGSASMGAFIAGIVLAGSPYAHQVLSEITPLKDALSSLFFASVGMMLVPMAWVQAPLLSVGLVAGAIGVKLFTGALPALALRLGPRGMVLGAAGVAQVGEFSFVLAKAGSEQGLFPEMLETQFVSVAVLSMALAPYVMRALASVADRRGLRAAETSEGGASGTVLTDHVILVGYGVTGRNVGRVLLRHKVPLAVIDLNPSTVRELRAQVGHVAYGDATQEGMLLHMGMADARALVIAIPDPAAARQIVAVARKMRPDVYIAVRTRLLAEVDALRALGAQDVVSEEFETSLELAGRALAAYGVSDRLVAREKATIRRERYASLLDGAVPPVPAEDLDALLAEADVSTLAVPPGSALVGRSLRSLDLRRQTGAMVIALTRDGSTTANPDPDLPLAAGDLLAVMGLPESVRAVRSLVLGEGPPAA